MASYQDLSEFERGVIAGEQEMGHNIFESRRLTRVPLLTAQHKALRLPWARQHRHWTVEDWKHAAWSDKSHFQWNRADERVRVGRQPHESMDPTYQHGTIQAGGASVMVWGVCSWRDMGPLTLPHTTLTEEISAPSYPYGFMDSLAGLLVSVASSTTFRR
ncbi:transposable element Tcb2 transposase [Trichonephila clavipes]|nr:transposable element Tcb2 transposase [Trichonephila clavipes]